MNPLICHDKDGYLKCYNDGNYIIKCSSGVFKEFRTISNSFIFSDDQKKLTAVIKNSHDSSLMDTIEITLQSRSLIIKKGNSSKLITSLNEIPEDLNDYGLTSYSKNNRFRGLLFCLADRCIKIEIWDFVKGWNWDIISNEDNRRFALKFYSFKKNRLEHIFIDDDSLRYGMSLSSSFKSRKKIWFLQSLYVDTLRTLNNGSPVIGAIPLQKNYKYEYNKSGRLKLDKVEGDFKICVCPDK